MVRSSLFACWLFLLAGALWTPPGSAIAQERPKPSLPGDSQGILEAFLRARGQFEDAQRILEAWNKLDPGEDPALNARGSRIIGVLVGMDILMNGYTFETVSRLKKAGYDLESVVRGVPGQGSLAGVAARSEMAVIATVVDRYESLVPRDGFRSSVVLQVQEVLRGSVEGQYVILRLLTGKNSRGGFNRVSHEFEGNKGESYLFFLSNGRYRFHAGYSYDMLDIGSVDLDYQAQDPQLDVRFMSVFAAIRMPDESGWGGLEPEINEVRRIGQLIRSHSR